MKIFPKRTLPAVGHKMPPQALFAGLMIGKVQLNLGLFDDAHDIVYTSSGSAALLVSLQACKMVSERKKVIIPAYTCPSVLAAVENAGLRAVLCDLAPGQLNLSESHLNDLLDSDTLAVIYVHLFGLDRRAAKIYSIVKNAGACLIEDAAQAFGNQVDGNYLGMDGDLAILSFGRGKPLSALHGGAVIVNAPDLAARVHEAMDMLAAPLPVWFGFYYRLLLTAYAILFNPELFAIPQAMPWFRIGETVYNDQVPVHHMASPARPVLNQLLQKRRKIQEIRSRLANKYLDKLMPFSHLFSFLPRLNDIATGPIRFPVVFKDHQFKSNCLSLLTDSHLGASGSYPTALNAQSGVPEYVTAQGPFPYADAVALGILTLPTHEHVKDQDINNIAKMIENFANL